MAQANKLVSLTREQFNTLVTNGTLTANGVTIEFNENDIYLTPQPSYYEQVDGVLMPSTAGTLATQEWVNANGGKIYEHNLLLTFGYEEDFSAYAKITIPSKSAIAFTKEQVTTYLLARNGLVNASVQVWDSTEEVPKGVGSLHIYNNSTFIILGYSDNNEYLELNTTKIASVTDTVIDTSTI